jgi:outer membrane protein TolC
LEVVQAQEALAFANESLISSLYAFNSAKAALARARGEGDEAVSRYLTGK